MRSDNVMVFGMAAVAVAVAMVFGVRAGDLSPPSGAVAPTMKTLHEVEPRTPLANDFVGLNPIVINAPGSYYLTEEIFGFGGQHAIQITADDVTLDLNGFAVRGNVEVLALDGIHLDSGRRNVVIHSGIVRDFGGEGIDGDGTEGVIVRDVIAFNNGLSGTGSGIRLGDNSMALGCIGQSNAGVGVHTGFQSVMRECLASDNGSDGLFINAGVAFGCVSSSNGQDGLQSNRGVISHCFAIANTDDGLKSGSGTVILGSAGLSNVNGIQSPNSMIVNNVAHNNSGVNIEGFASSTEADNHESP